MNNPQRMHTTISDDAPSTVYIRQSPLTRSEVLQVVRGKTAISLSHDAIEAIDKAHRYLHVHQGDIYGVTSGVGGLAGWNYPTEQAAEASLAVVRSHAAGIGQEVEREVVRSLMLLRLHTFATGHSGIQQSTVDTLTAMLNADIVPVVREHGSLGCSGDLAPLAAIALALTGEGTVRDHRNHLMPAAEALKDAGLKPARLAQKEGLSLINGTDGMLGMLILAVTDLALLLDLADLTAALSVQALLGTNHAFVSDLQALRPHPGQATSAKRLISLLANSEILASRDDHQTQDAYSLRCVPQVHGAARDALTYAEMVADRELAAAIDNPVILSDGRIESNGNFHGAPLAYVLDFLAIPATDVASMAERRTDRMLDPSRSHGLPAFLAHQPGVDSGYMIAHYTQASLVSELKRLAVPASVDSIPTSAMQEDHVSMGWSAARKLRKGLDDLTAVLAIELLTAARAVDLRAPLKLSPATASAVALLRRTVPGPGPDRPITPEIDKAIQLIHSSQFQEIVAS